MARFRLNKYIFLSIFIHTYSKRSLYQGSQPFHREQVCVCKNVLKYLLINSILKRSTNFTFKI